MCRAPLRRIGTLALLVCLSSRSADAAPPESLPKLDLTYVAPPGCPDRDELLEDLGRRVNPAWHTGADPRRFVLRIKRLESGAFSGRLEVARAGHETEAREFQAKTCGEVSSALVVFIAIALDPASTETQPELPPPSVPPPKPSETPPLPPREFAAHGPMPAHSQLSQRAPSSWIWTSSVALVAQRLPVDAWGTRIAAELARTTEGLRIAPALRIGWGSVGFETRPPDGGTARFRIQSAHISACARVDLAPAPITVAPCAGFEHGSLIASSRDLPQVGHASSTWSAMAGLARATWWIVPWLGVEGEVGLVVPFSRPTFALTEPVRIVYRPSSVVFTAGAGLAVSARFR